MRRLILPLATLAILFTGCSSDSTQQSAPPPEVIVYVARAETLPQKQDFVGHIYGFKDIAIRARVEGFLEGIHFQEGSNVEEGALLYSLESQPFEANEAAMLSKVAEARTGLAKTKSDLNRIRPLAEQRAVSASDLDAAVALHDAAIASVEAAEANLRASRIQLSYTKMRSPINGIIGKTQAKVGDFVGKNPNPVILNTVSRLDTVLVEFFITEEQYLALNREFRKNLGVRQDRDEPNLELLLADGSLYEHLGVAVFADREIDSTTGALLVQSAFPNPEALLRPGLFALVRATVRTRHNAIRVPQRCVSELQGRFSVFVVGNDNKAERRPVVVGEKLDDFWVIESGLQAGDRVIYEGLQRVGDGIAVKPLEKDVQPKIREGS